MPFITKKKHRALIGEIEQLQQTATSLKRAIQRGETPTNVSLEFEMVVMRSKGMTYEQIADELNSRGVASPKGSRWYGSTVRPRVLKANGSDPLNRTQNRGKRNRKVGA